MEKIQFKYITEEGNYRCKTFNVDVPEFKDYSAEFDGIKFIVKKESQIMGFLDEMDKTDFMQENGIVTILDYKPFIKKRKVNKEYQVLAIFKDLIHENENKEQIYFDFVAVATKMKHSIKNMPIDKQISVVLDALIIGYSAQSNVLKELSDFKEDLKTDFGKLKPHNERFNYLNSKSEHKQLSE